MSKFFVNGKEYEFKIKVQSLVDHIDVSEADPIETLKAKLNIWPILVEAKLISEVEFKKKQTDVIDSFTNCPWSNVPEFSVVVERLMALKDCNWLTELDFHAKKVELLILDEPTASLNESESKNLLDLLKKFKKCRKV